MLTEVLLLAATVAGLLISSKDDAPPSEGAVYEPPQPMPVPQAPTQDPDTLPPLVTMPPGPLQNWTQGEQYVVLTQNCVWDKPNERIVIQQRVGPNVTEIRVPIMNAYAGCRTPVRVNVCVELGGIIGGWPAELEQPPEYRPSSWARSFVLDIVGNADGSPRLVKVRDVKAGSCDYGHAPPQMNEVKSVRGMVVMGAAGIALNIKPRGNIASDVRVTIDAAK